MQEVALLVVVNLLIVVGLGNLTILWLVRYQEEVLPRLFVALYLVREVFEEGNSRAAEFMP